MKSNRSKPLVAIVDDAASVRRSMMRLVSSSGIDAAPFSSGREFIDMLEQFPSFSPDCVIIDIAMPDVNGLEVQKDLHLLRPRVPVVFVTAMHDEWIQDEALASGALAVFRKPIDDESFIRALHEALKIDGPRKP